MLSFTKMHGIGNDFVFLDLIKFDYQIDDISALSSAMCDRHTGVGADGLILISRGQEAPFRMTMYNPDGSNGGMCGNGVRCAAKLLIDAGHQPMQGFDLEVEERIVRVEPVGSQGRGTRNEERGSDQAVIRVNMGQAVLDRQGIGMLGSAQDRFVDQPLETSNNDFKGLAGTAVSMGNPHLVLFTDDVASIDLAKIGPKLEHHPWFPFRTNVHFVQAVDSDHVIMRTWERGAGITLACGSGACSVGVASYLTGHTGRSVSIKLPGGTLKIDYREDGEVMMEGPAETSFEGQWFASCGARQDAVEMA